MAIPNSNFGLIATTSLNNYGKVMADNVTKNNYIGMFLEKKGRRRLLDGGDTIVRAMAYAETGTYQRYSGGQVLNISPSDELTSAQFPWAQAAITVTITGREMRQNGGSERIFDLLKEKIQNAENAAQNGMAQDFYSDGSASGGLQTGGLQLLVANNPTTGTVGGIDRSQWIFWQNQKVTAGAFTAASITGFMDKIYLNLRRGTDAPEAVITDNIGFTKYWNSLQAIQRITSVDKAADAGYKTLEFMGMPVAFDGGQGGFCPASTMYFLNSRYLNLDVHRDANWTWLPELRSINQDAYVRTSIWMGQMTSNGLKFQGVINVT